MFKNRYLTEVLGCFGAGVAATTTDEVALLSSVLCSFLQLQQQKHTKKQTLVATSLSVANFPIGIFPKASFLNSLFLKNLLTIGVATKVGATVFTLILFFASSTPIPLVKPSIPNFVML